MENKNLKNILVAAGLAVFAGVLTLGVNAAFGSVDAPTQNPADASLHSPRFNDVDVSGDLTVNHNLKVADAIKANTVDEKVTINGGIDVFGDSSRFTPISEDKSTIEIDGDIKFTDTDSLIYNDTNSPITILGALTADRFGTYFEVNSSLDKINKNTTLQVSVSCPVDAYLVSCQSMSATSNVNSGGAADFTNNFTKDVYINYAYADQDADNDGNATENDNVCKVRGFNANQTTDRYIGASAVCLNPSI